MNANTRRLVLLLARFQRRVDEAHADMMEAAEMDAHYDGGEWSGPAHARLFEENVERLAVRAGFATADAAYAACERLGVHAENLQFVHEGTVTLP